MNRGAWLNILSKVSDTMAIIRNTFFMVLALLLFTAAPSASAADKKSAPSQPQLSIGDSLSEYMKQYPVKFKRRMDDISDWTEGRDIDALMYTKGYDDRFPVVLSSGKTPFGVAQRAKSKAYFLFDTDGDGKLDYRSETAFLPIWLVLRHSPVQDPEDRTPDKFMGLLYDTFQSDKGPADAGWIKQALGLLKPYYMDRGMPNRDLMYLLYYYIAFTKKPEQAILAMKKMEERYMARYGGFHPVILLHLVESNINAGRIEVARAYSERLVKLFPEFVPAQFYHWQLQESSAPDDDLARELKKRYPDHWLVKKIGSR